MTTQTEATDPAPRRMTCVRRLYVLEDEAGRTWLAAEEAAGGGSVEDDSPAEGGAMSHRVGRAAGRAGDQGGGAMFHLVPGDTAEVEGDGPDQVTVLVPPRPGGLPQRLQAYRVSAALLPSGSDPSSA